MSEYRRWLEAKQAAEAATGPSATPAADATDPIGQLGAEVTEQIGQPAAPEVLTSPYPGPAAPPYPGGAGADYPAPPQATPFGPEPTQATGSSYPGSPSSPGGPVPGGSVPGGLGNPGSPGGWYPGAGYPGVGYPSTGSPGGFGPPPSGGGPGGSPSGSNPTPRRRRGRRLAAAGALGVLLLAAVGAGGYLLGARSGTTSSSAPLRTVNISAAASSNGINVEAIVQKVEPAVVDILTKGGVSGTSSAFEAAGTGMIITPSGEVVTNNHVVVDATTIRVRIYGQRTLHRARVIGVDPSKDIAVIQIEGVSHLPTVTFGNSAQVKVGTPVVAIGNALDLSGAPTVTEGIVSALGRSITASDSLLPGGSEHLTGLIQTDAPINPGNSGGPLVDSSGQVIGMNTAVLASAGSTPTSGIGFAIPSDRIVRIADEIRAGHKGNGIELGAPALLGVVVENDNPAIQAEYSLGTAHGALVLQVLAGSGAAHAGLRPGDVITGVDGHSVTNATELKDLIVAHKPGTSITVQWVTTSGRTEHASALLIAGPVA